MAARSLCEIALEAHADRLSELPNVVGLGIAPLGDDRSKSDDLGIAVYVKKKVDKEKLERIQRVPKFVRIKRGNRIRNVYTRVIEQGAVSLENGGDVFSKESL